MHRFCYHITVEDILDFNEFYLLNTTSGKKSIRSYRIFVPVCFVLVLAVLYINDMKPLTLIIYSAAAVIFSVLWQLRCHKLILSVLKKNMKKQSGAESGLYSPDGEIIFDFDNGIIIDIGQKEEVRVKFNEIIACYDGKTAFYLYFSKAKGFILPYSSFSSPEECFSFAKILHTAFPTNDI